MRYTKLSSDASRELNNPPPGIFHLFSYKRTSLLVMLINQSVRNATGEMCFPAAIEDRQL